MRFEITHENGQKEIKEFHGDKAVVGSGDNTDIRILGDHVAKNQIIIEKIEGKIYITDLDNENGTYINDELVEPHKRIEFLSFFPVQIGPKVFIHLLPDEEQKPEAPASKPGIEFELASPPPKKSPAKKTASTAANVLAPKKTVPGKPISKTSKSKPQNQLALGLLSLSLGLGYFIYHTSKEDITPETIAAIQDPQLALKEVENREFLNRYEKNLEVDKCRNEIEQQFCRFFSHNLQKNEGYMIENGVLFLYLNLDRSLSGPMRSTYNNIPNPDQFNYFLVSTIFNYQFLTLLEEHKISHLNFILFNVIEGKMTPTKYFSNSVDYLLKNVAIDDVRAALAEAQQRNAVNLQDLIQPHIDWVNFK